MKHFQKGHMSGYFRSRKIGKLEQNVSKMAANFLESHKEASRQSLRNRLKGSESAEYVWLFACFGRMDFQDGFL